MNPEKIFRRLLSGEEAYTKDDSGIRVSKNKDSFDIYVADDLAMKMWRYGWVKYLDDGRAAKAESFLRSVGKAQ